MSIKRIVFHVDDGNGYEDRLAAALLFAHQRQATLEGVYSLVAPDIPPYAAAMIPEEVLVTAWDRACARATAVETAFLHAAQTAGVLATWTLANQEPAEALINASHVADLVIVPQPDDDASPRLDVVDRVALNAGRPVLMLPRRAAHLGFGARVLLAWNASRESARALGDGMPWLHNARRVDVVSVAKPDAFAGRLGPQAVCDYLKSHDITATAHTLPVGHGDVGTTLTRWAAEQSVDLVIMGAYGHSRLRELVVGGATATLIADSKVPVLFAH